MNQNGTNDRVLLFQDQESRRVPFRDRPVGVWGVMFHVKAIGMYIPIGFVVDLTYVWAAYAILQPFVL